MLNAALKPWQCLISNWLCFLVDFWQDRFDVALYNPNILASGLKVDES